MAGDQARQWDVLESVRVALAADVAVVLQRATAGPGLGLVAGDGPALPPAWAEGDVLHLAPSVSLKGIATSVRDIRMTCPYKPGLVDLASAVVVPMRIAKTNCWLIVGGVREPVRDLSYVAGSSQALLELLELDRLRREYRVYRSVDRGAHRLAEAASAGFDLPVVLRAIVQTTREILGCDASYVSLPAGDNDETFEMVTFANVRTSAFRHLEVRYGEGLGGLARARRRPILVVDYPTDARLKNAPVDITLREGFRIAASAPLMVDGEVIGCLYAANRRRGQLTEDDAKLLGLFSSHAAAAIESGNKREVDRAHVRAKEREQLTFELHDSVVRSLVGIALEAEAGARASNSAEEVLDSIARSARETLELMRATLSSEHRVAMHSNRLSEILDALKATAALKPGQREFMLASSDQNVDSGIYRCLVAVGQEAIVNAELHSGSDQVQVEVGLRDNEVTLSVHDGGNGFAAVDCAKPHHYGLRAIHRRVSDHGGRVWFDKPAGGGFVVHVAIPTDP